MRSELVIPRLPINFYKNIFPVIAHLHYLARALSALYVLVEYGIEYGVVGQAVAVLLAGAQLGAWGLVYNVLRYYLAIAVDVARQCIYLLLIQVAQHTQPAGHIAI